MDESATYSELREKLLSFERTTTSYSSQAVCKDFDIGIRDDKQQHVVPMDTERIKRKEKGKAKGKNKGKRLQRKRQGQGLWRLQHCI